MASAKSRSKTEKERCKRYQAQNLREKNRAKKLARHIKKFPNDAIAIAASKVSPSPKKAPRSQVWSKTDIRFASLYKKFGRSGKEFLADKEVQKLRLSGKSATA